MQNPAVAGCSCGSRCAGAHLSQLADEEDEHDPEEGGGGARAHQDDHLNVGAALLT